MIGANLSETHALGTASAAEPAAFDGTSRATSKERAAFDASLASFLGQTESAAGDEIPAGRPAPVAAGATHADLLAVFQESEAEVIKAAEDEEDEDHEAEGDRQSLDAATPEVANPLPVAFPFTARPDELVSWAGGSMVGGDEVPRGEGDRGITPAKEPDRRPIASKPLDPQLAAEVQAALRRGFDHPLPVVAADTAEDVVVPSAGVDSTPSAVTPAAFVVETPAAPATPKPAPAEVPASPSPVPPVATTAIATKADGEVGGPKAKSAGTPAGAQQPSPVPRAAGSADVPPTPGAGANTDANVAGAKPAPAAPMAAAATATPSPPRELGVPGPSVAGPRPGTKAVEAPGWTRRRAVDTDIAVDVARISSSVFDPTALSTSAAIPAVVDRPTPATVKNPATVNPTTLSASAAIEEGSGALAVRAAEAIGHKRALFAPAHGEIVVPELGRVEVQARFEGSGVDVRVRAHEEHTQHVIAASAPEMRAHVQVELPNATVHVERSGQPDLAGFAQENGSSRDLGRQGAERREHRSAERNEDDVAMPKRPNGGRVRFVL